MQIYENKAFYVIGMFLDIRFVECFLVCLRRNYNNSSVDIQITRYFVQNCLLWLGFYNDFAAFDEST